MRDGLEQRMSIIETKDGDGEGWWSSSVLGQDEWLAGRSVVCRTACQVFANGGLEEREGKAEPTDKWVLRSDCCVE